jgi:hypothetical protein
MRLHCPLVQEVYVLYNRFEKNEILVQRVSILKLCSSLEEKGCVFSISKGFQAMVSNGQVIFLGIAGLLQVFTNRNKQSKGFSLRIFLSIMEAILQIRSEQS